jgi:hypothetical protein
VGGGGGGGGGGVSGDYSVHRYFQQYFSYIVAVRLNVGGNQKSGIPGENYRPATSHWQNLSLNLSNDITFITYGSLCLLSFVCTFVSDFNLWCSCSEVEGIKELFWVEKLNIVNSWIFMDFVDGIKPWNEEFNKYIWHHIYVHWLWKGIHENN